MLENASQSFAEGQDHQGEAASVALLTPAAPAPARRPAATLPQLLVDMGLLSPEQVAKALESARRERMPLGRLLARDGLVVSRHLATLTALHLGLTMVDMRSQDIDRQAVALLPEEIARKYLALPIRKAEGRLLVAMSDPTELQMLQDLTARTGMTIEPVISTPEDILEHIDLSYRLSQSAPETHEDGEEPAQRVTSLLVREAMPAQVIELLLRQALQDRASDIHIEPMESRLRIRFRIDGILHDVMNLPLEMHPALLSRLKIMCGLNIAERRRPQDGQLTYELSNRRIDVRVATSSTVGGEMAVLRLLDNKKFTLLSLDQLGFAGQALEQYRYLLQLPYGMIIVCGPTGSGKSTSLYASILQMNRVERKVISIEDPVEYHIADVNQMQVNPASGVTFATQLRSILRLDPDVILVGEIRDQETAIIATQAALTGHLVLTSLHANDAVSALLRLRDLGVPAYLIASSVAGVVGQRMVRMVCNTCQKLEPRPLAEQQAYQREMGETRDRFSYGTGCNVCAQTGYLGRTGVFEILTLSDSMRQAFLEDAPRHVLWEQAINDGTIPLRRDGMIKVQQGITTPYEVMRVLFNLD